MIDFMGHAVSLYKVDIKELGKDPVEFGDFDGTGKYLGDVLKDGFSGFDRSDEEEGKVARCTEVNQDGDDLLVTLVHGQSGRAGDIIDQDGNDQYRLAPTDTMLVRCGCIFRLPRNQKVGWLLFHVNDNHGTKTLVEQGARGHVESKHTEMRLQISPWVPGSALAQAAEDGLIEKVRLQRWVKPSDSSDAQKWVPDGFSGKIELSISIRERTRRIASDLIKRFANGDHAALDSIIEFDGVKFEKVRVEAVFNGRLRTFYLERPASGHALTEDITNEVKLAGDGQPSMDSVWAALRDRMPDGS